MDIGLISRVLLLSISLIAINKVAAVGMPDFYGEPGLNPNRSISSSTDFDAIDPFSGKLQLHQTDIFIPGNAGMNLEVSRSYTSGNIWGQGFGYSGWTMDFGYVETSFSYFTSCPTGVYYSNDNNPVLVLPDGSRQVLADVDISFPSPAYTFPYITNKFWKAECLYGSTGGMLVTSPDGKIYTMNYSAPAKVGGADYIRWYVTKITDKNGNWIDITYSNPQANGAIVNTVTTSDGRALNYSYTTPDAYGLVRLASITDGSRTWKYEYIDGTTMDLSVGTFLLNKVTLPDDTTWVYTYNGNLGYNNDPNLYGGSAIIPGSYMINSVTTPEGMVVNYHYDYVQFNPAGGYETAVTTRSVAAGDTWTYVYTPSSGPDVLDTTTVNIGGRRTDTYSHFGYNTIAQYNEIWKVGLLAQKTTGSAQVESYTWGHYTVTSRQVNLRPYGWSLKVDSGLHNPILLSKIISRDGANYITNFNTIDFFGNSWETLEFSPSGKNRTTTLGYSVTTYQDPKWILHQKIYEFYNGLNHAQVLDANNNVLIDTKALVTTAYTYNSDGTVATMTPPGGAVYTYDMFGFPTSASMSHGTSFGAYMRGIPLSETQQEGISVYRGVSGSGVVTSETNGNGNTTTYGYDSLNRLTSVNHPINNGVNISYTPTSKTASRGSLVENTLYDFYKRPISVTLGGITTTYQYDVLGRMTFKSNPNSSAGTSYNYDDIGRVTKVTNADGSFKSTVYAPTTRTVTDENGNQTIYTFYTYGDPDKTYLTGITTPDPAASISITRDELDNVTSVTQAGITRNYVYGANGFLYQETDPETGVTNYNRDDAGNITSRLVGTTGWANYTYDYHNRLATASTYLSYTTNTYSKTHKLLSSTYSDGYVFGGFNQFLSPSTRSFTYDANDNMVMDNILVDGYNLATGYAYNGNDQISSITYPISNQVVSFTPDVLGRPTAVAGYAINASYWPSGQVKQISYQNGVISNYGQNTRLWPSSFGTQSSAGNLIDSSYLYDPVGNLTSIADTTTPAFNRAFGYDALDRLTTVNASGSWGAGTIAYNGAGNITSQTFGTTGLTYNYSQQNQIASVTGTLRNANYTYDVYGNVLTDGAGKYFFYDDHPSLVRVGDTNSSAPPTYYTYDGLNKRIKVEKNNILTYEFYDLSGKLLAEYTPGQSNKLVEYMYLGGMRIAQRTTNH